MGEGNLLPVLVWVYSVQGPTFWKGPGLYIWTSPSPFETVFLCVADLAVLELT